jgi:predicted peptidase
MISFSNGTLAASAKGTVFVTMTAVVSVLGAVATGQRAPAQQNAPTIVSATVIAESLPVGFRVSAVAVEYSNQLDLGSAAIPPLTFSVVATLEPEAKIAPGARTVTRAYTNDAPARSSQSKPGKYVILELSSTDPNGVGNYYRPNSILLNLQNAYSVRQVDPIKTRNTTIPASATAITNSNVVRPIVEDFSAHVYTDPNGVSLDYRQFTPAAAKGAASTRKFPLVFALHGLGSSGTDNLSQVVGESMVVQFALPERQAKTPVFIVAPQRKDVAMGPGWTAPEMQDALANLAKHAIATLPIDPDRVYLIGLSMGSNGGGTLLRQHRNLFAASLQTAGFRVSEADVLANLRDFPMWVSHGTDDKLTPYDADGAPLRALNALKASGTPVVFGEWAANLSVEEANTQASALLAEARKAKARHLFTTYTGGTNPVFGHGSWIPMFSTPVIHDWLFSHVRGKGQGE